MPPTDRELPVDALLAARLSALRGGIAQTRRLLESIPDDLRGTVDARMGTALHRLEFRATRIPTGPDGWEQAHVLALELAELGDESLALAAGALLRGAGADRGACAHADTLIAEILRRTQPSWSSFTVPAIEAYYARPSQVVRVRLGVSWFWELPVAAHELGHYAAAAISYEVGGTTVHPVEKWLTKDRWAHRNEIFADVFAIWTVGPAYALACVFHGFDPVGSGEGDDTHPAATVRIAAMRRVLDRLDREAYENIGARIITTWEAMRSAAGAEPPAPEDLTTAYDWCDEVLDLLDEHVFQARWDGWWQARQLATELAGGSDVDAAKYDMRTVLNGGWLARLEGGEDLDGRVRSLAAAVRSLATAVRGVARA